ncbi:hypothetical protein BBK36DRAFT_1188409 [Trichoderma citrinoviride]|uniref:Uncharacterized protein n=1 Tax=Trichoderma citrinoviride TaxID=58853 RepID=A0A2T4BKD2_9HYPO|nr:hypothetical protein BBK36DRAFT_1188409 [Trichoderma citrinoviride]PTB69766.1 hypothetical protein BBK36DRAFT_1188409 [Trichoderma citrinoviride]
MASIGNAARQVRDRVLSERSIRVLVTPTPITFAERRSVLQVLEQYGPVEFFKMTPAICGIIMQGYHANFVSITKESTTAERLVASSPLTYKITEPVRSAVEDIYVADLDEPESFSTAQPTITGEQRRNASPLPNGINQRPEEGLKQGQREFMLEIFPVPEFNHRFAMAGSLLHGSWPEGYEGDQSFIATTLQQSLPKSIASKGLVHWMVGPSPRMVAPDIRPKNPRKERRLQIKGWLPSLMKKGTTE